jgi:hypothetical protein
MPTFVCRCGTTPTLRRLRGLTRAGTPIQIGASGLASRLRGPHRRRDDRQFRLWSAGRRRSADLRQWVALELQHLINVRNSGGMNMDQRRRIP